MHVRLTLLAAAIVLLATAPVWAASSVDALAECDQTEYAAYRACVHHRFKRQNVPANTTAQPANAKIVAAEAAPITIVVNNETITPTGNGDTSSLLTKCKRVNFDCRIACGNDTACEDKCPECPLNADKVANDYQTVVLESEDGQSEQFQARIEAGRNVTTIIRLTNIINNTNTINMPTNVTTTNVNNIHVHAGNNGTAKSSEEGGDYGLGYTEKGSCCIVVRAKTCAPSTSGPRCQHRRHKTCDDTVCKARIMHAQVRRRCERNGVCHKKIVYVPEPGPQKCVHIDSWPHVVCGTVVPRKKKCDGCYDHYGYGFENYHGKGLSPQCRGCFDDAWDEGQRYRRGPVLRPFYYHQPPCYLTGSCVPVVDCGYGCYGDEFVDPAWGHPQRRPRPQADRDVYYEDEIDDADDITDRPTDENTTTDPDDDEWIEEDTKCKVVSENGTIISNCTGNSLDGNDFAKEPNVNFVDDLEQGDTGDFSSDSRYRRHAVHPFQVYQPNPYRPRHTKSYLDDNMVDDMEDDDGENHKRASHRNQIAGDFEYDYEMDHPYKRPQRRPHRKNRRAGRHGKGRKSHGRRHRKVNHVDEAKDE